MTHSSDSSSSSNTSERIRAASDVIARTLGDSAVLIHLGTNKIFELNATGARIWEMLANGATPPELVHTLAQEFDVPSEEISPAVDELLAALRAEHLI